MAKMKSRLPDRRKAAQAIEDMAADLQARGLALFGIYPPTLTDNAWLLVVVDADGESQRFEAAILDDCYLAAMHYPDTPPPF